MPSPSLAESQQSRSDNAVNKSPSNKRFLSKRQLAAYLSVSIRTIDALLAARKIPVVKLSARLCRFREGDVEKALGRFTIHEVGR